MIRDTIHVFCVKSWLVVIVLNPSFAYLPVRWTILLLEPSLALCYLFLCVQSCWFVAQFHHCEFHYLSPRASFTYLFLRLFQLPYISAYLSLMSVSFRTINTLSLAVVLFGVCSVLWYVVQADSSWWFPLRRRPWSISILTLIIQSRSTCCGCGPLRCIDVLSCRRILVIYSLCSFPLTYLVVDFLDIMLKPSVSFPFLCGVVSLSPRRSLVFVESSIPWVVCVPSSEIS